MLQNEYKLLVRLINLYW